jgi:transcriptional regulator with XRE-family HTH domain
MAKQKGGTLRVVFGTNVRLERARQGLTQEDLAAAADMDQSYVSQLERGVLSPTLDVVERLATALQVQPTALMDVTLGRR